MEKGLYLVPGQTYKQLTAADRLPKAGSAAAEQAASVPRSVCSAAGSAVADSAVAGSVVAGFAVEWAEAG